LFFGNRALRATSFPLLFLVFMISIPTRILGAPILWLQKGSAQAAAVLFKLFAIPVFQQGFDFTLPGVTIRMAEECNGIRSTLALLITAVVASHISLRTTWRKILFLPSCLPDWCAEKWCANRNAIDACPLCESRFPAWSPAQAREEYCFSFLAL
jgi:exosortase